MTSTSSRSEPAESTGCAAALGQPAAGCVQLTSEGGTTGNELQASDASTGCAAIATADTTPERPKPPQTTRELEHALRGLGYSQRQAAAIARNGFRAAAAATEAPSVATLEPLRAALLRNLKDITS